MASIGKTEKYPLEIINAGLHRGGTTSLSLALQELGFGPTWHLITNSDELNNIGKKWWIDNNIFSKLENNEKVNFDEWLQRIKCKTISDTPVIFCWDKIFAQYPDCKIIISVRPFDKWSKSYTNLLSLLSGPSMSLPKHFDIWTKLLCDQWDMYHIGDEYKGLSELISLDTSKLQRILKEKYYDGFVGKVKKIVPKDQLLIFRPNEGWKPLCQFLNVSVPNKPFPMTNNTKQLNKFVFEWKMNAIKSNINVYYILCGILLLVSMWFYYIK
eukprot:450882_1